MAITQKLESRHNRGKKWKHRGWTSHWESRINFILKVRKNFIKLNWTLLKSKRKPTCRIRQGTLSNRDWWHWYHLHLQSEGPVSDVTPHCCDLISIPKCWSQCQDSPGKRYWAGRTNPELLENTSSPLSRLKFNANIFIYSMLLSIIYYPVPYSRRLGQDVLNLPLKLFIT